MPARDLIKILTDIFVRISQPIPKVSFIISIRVFVVTANMVIERRT